MLKDSNGVQVVRCNFVAPGVAQAFAKKGGKWVWFATLVRDGVTWHVSQMEGHVFGEVMVKSSYGMLTEAEIDMAKALGFDVCEKKV